MFRAIFEYLFSFVLFAKAFMFVPQLWRIWQKKEVKALSLTTFLSMNLMQILMIIHAYLRDDLVLMSGITFSLLISGAISASIIYFRFIRKQDE